jgi:hypothetical protein
MPLIRHPRGFSNENPPPYKGKGSIPKGAKNQGRILPKPESKTGKTMEGIQRTGERRENGGVRGQG